MGLIWSNLEPILQLDDVSPMHHSRTHGSPVLGTDLGRCSNLTWTQPIRCFAMVAIPVSFSNNIVGANPDFIHTNLLVLGFSHDGRPSVVGRTMFLVGTPVQKSKGSALQKSMLKHFRSSSLCLFLHVVWQRNNN